MKKIKDKKDGWDDAVRSKLFDAEAPVDADLWERIAARLDASDGVARGRVIPIRSYLRYAAAVAAVLLLGGGILYTVLHSDKATLGIDNEMVSLTWNPVGDDSASESSVRGTKQSIEKIETGLLHSVRNDVMGGVRNDGKEKVRNDVRIDGIRLSSSLRGTKQSIEKIETGFHSVRNDGTGGVRIDGIRLSSSLRGTKQSGKKIASDNASKPRRWGIGIGGGGYSASTSSGSAIMSPAYTALYNDYHNFSNMKQMQSDMKNPSEAGNIDEDGLIAPSADTKWTYKHKVPISTGLGISYFLNDRFTLQSGLVYTLLRSEGSFSNEYNSVKLKQTLHFIGVPVEVSYKIADWKKARFYVSAGGMGELNFSGYHKKFIDDQLFTKESIRIKEPLWSLNAHAGVSYPLWRFINIYAETGASYYFDYKSSKEIETIRSEKPFFVSLQAGIRFGF